MIWANQLNPNAVKNPMSSQGRPMDPSIRPMQNNILPMQMERGDYNSSYTDDYIKHQTANAPKVTRYDIINKNFIFPQEKFNGESNYSGSYRNTTESRTRPERINYADNDVIPKGKFQGNSSYLDAYNVSSQGPRRQPVRHEGELRLGGRFEGSSNYTDNYPNKGIQERQQKVSFLDNKILPQGKFQNTSTYNGNYVVNPIQVNQQIKREGELRVGGKFQGYSSYAADYDQRNRSQSKREKITYKDNDVMPRGQFQGNSTYQTNYLNNEQFTPSKLIKQAEQIKVGGQFYGSSNYASNYDNKGLGERRQMMVLPQNKIFSQGKFDDFTTYSGNYIQNPLQKNGMIRPQGQLKVNIGVFNANSSYGSDYIKRQNDGRQKAISYPVNDVIPRGNFTGNSTYGDNYIPSAIERREQFFPEGNIRVGGKFEGNSNYTENYDGGSPAKYLNKQNEYGAYSKQR